MKKYLYLFAFALLLYLISIIPVSAKEIRTCVRTANDLHVREKFNLGTNQNDIMTTPCVDEVQKVYDFADLLTDEDCDVEKDILFSIVFSRVVLLFIT